jgi:hypothetical protein
MAMRRGQSSTGATVARGRSAGARDWRPADGEVARAATALRARSARMSSAAGLTRRAAPCSVGAPRSRRPTQHAGLSRRLTRPRWRPGDESEAARQKALAMPARSAAAVVPARRWMAKAHPRGDLARLNASRTLGFVLGAKPVDEDAQLGQQVATTRKVEKGRERRPHVPSRSWGEPARARRFANSRKCSPERAFAKRALLHASDARRADDARRRV